MTTTNPTKVQDLQFAQLTCVWLFFFFYCLVALACCQTYYIVDAKHGTSMSTSITRILQIGQMPSGSWSLFMENLASSLSGIQSFGDALFLGTIMMAAYIIRLDGNSPNAKWCLLPFTNIYGSITHEILDQKHSRAIVAGNHADNNIYHQYPDLCSNVRWALIRN